MPEQDNASPSMMWKAILAAVVLMVLIVPFSLRDKSAGSAATASDEAEARIAPVARVQLLKAAASSGPRSGEQIYNSVCTACHSAGVAGAPKKGDKAAWAPRLGQGLDGLVKSATAGKGGMPPKGGAADLSEAELRAAIEFLTK
ncbi:MAG TPA: c-type cytochrome [Rhodocyclaceae bacterium]|nr:c-type cytochrome [Rhodocyclaceae bacterium]